MGPLVPLAWLRAEVLVEYGLCECGCGRETNIGNRNDKGQTKGQPNRYLRGHGSKGKTPEYIEEDRGYSTPCWVWNRYTDLAGYGRKGVLGKTQLAHRWYWESVNGPVPDGLVVDHLCNVKGCVNPEHLEPVTQSENQYRAVKYHMDSKVAGTAVEDDTKKPKRSCRMPFNPYAFLDSDEPS